MIRRKKVTLICIGMLLFSAAGSMSVFSQDDRQTLKNSAALGGYGAPTFMATSFFNFSQWDALFGIRGGLSINQLTIGGTVASTESTGKWVRVDVDDSSEKQSLAMLYSGLFLEYTLDSKNMMHFSFPLEIVAGAIRIGDVGYTYGNADSQLFFGAIPGANLDINVAHFFVIGIHAGYRFVVLYDDVDKYDGAIESGIDLWGLQTGFIFRFGKFI